MVTAATAELTLTELSRRSCADLTHVRYRSAADGHWCEPSAGSGEVASALPVTSCVGRPVGSAS